MSTMAVRLLATRISSTAAALTVRRAQWKKLSWRALTASAARWSPDKVTHTGQVWESTAEMSLDIVYIYYITPFSPIYYITMAGVINIMFFSSFSSGKTMTTGMSDSLIGQNR